MKKVFLVTLSLEGGGAEKIAHLLLENFDPVSYELKLITFKDTEAYQVSEKIGKLNLKKRRRLDLFGLIWKLSRILKNENPFAVISFMTYPNIISLLAKHIARWKGRLILSEHANVLISLQHQRAAKIKKWLIKYLYPRSHCVVCVSDGVKNDLIRNSLIPDRKLKTIYNGINIIKITDMAKQVPPLYVYERKKEPIIVSVGRLTMQKQYQDLLKAFAIVKQKIDCRLVLVGEGIERKNLERLADDLGISQFIHMVGFQSNPFSFVAHSDVFVLPSLWEGFAIVLIEAMACGVPVISTNCPSGPDEIITDGVNGILVPVGDIDAIAKAILKLLSDQAVRKRLTEAGRKRAKDFRVEKMVSEYEKVIEGTN